MLHYDWLSPSVVTYPPTPPSKKIQTGNTSGEPFLPSLSLFFNKAKASDSNENKTVKVQKQNTRVTNSERCHLVCKQVKWKTNYTHLHTPGFTTTYTSLAESQSYHACICTPQLTSSTWTACTQSASLILQFKHITTHHQCQRHPQGCRHMAAAVTDSDKPQLNSTVPTGMLVDRTPDPWTLPSPQSCPMAVGMKGGGGAEGEAEDWKSQWTSTSWAGFKFRHHVQRDSNAAEEGGQQKPQACIHGEAPVTFKTSRFLCWFVLKTANLWY